MVERPIIAGSRVLTDAVVVCEYATRAAPTVALALFTTHASEIKLGPQTPSYLAAARSVAHTFPLEDHPPSTRRWLQYSRV
jgi:hypothetical protein